MKKALFILQKDYKELIPFTKPYNDKVKITFSSEPFKSSTSKPAASFTSKSHIYAKIENTAGSIKDAFKLTDGNDKLMVDFIIYNDDISNVAVIKSIVNHLYLTPADATAKFIDFDILPAPTSITPHATSAEDFYFPGFYGAQEE